MTQAPAAKRSRFSAKNFSARTPARSNDASANGDGSDLVVSIRRWGSSYGVFEDGSRTETLWQLQVAHGGKSSFGYNLFGVCKEALATYPDTDIRDLTQLERKKHIKVLHGAPPMTGPSDPDNVGLAAWQPVVYAPNTDDGLNLIHFVTKHKVGAGDLLQLPNFIAVFPDGGTTPVPTPWMVHKEHALQLSPFKSVPPKGRRHVLMQIELDRAASQAATADDELTGSDHESHPSNYSIMLFGGLYDYRTFFDALGIQGGSVPMADGEKSEYVRYVRITDTLEDRKRLTAILEQVLLRVPVYLIDETQQQDDPLVSWLLDQPAVHLGEKHTTDD